MYIGSGFVGTSSAAVAADSGHSVLVYDIDQKKVENLSSLDREKILSYLFEEGLSDLLIRNKERIKFTFDYQDVVNFVNNVDVVFFCIDTPEIGETGECNLENYLKAVEKLSLCLSKRNNNSQEKYLVLVNKSTLPIDTISQTEEIMKIQGVRNFGVVSNPEFLVEGKAVQGSLKPDRIVIGAWNEQDFKIMRQVYQRFFDSPSVQYIEVNPKEAAAGKLLANFYLFNKLALCFDVMGRTCEVFSDLKFENLRKILTTDKRIGDWGFYDSLYAGGSCFIKDARSLSYQLQTKRQNTVIVSETYLANKRQLELFLSRAVIEAKIDWKDKKVALIGLAFKRDTNDIRNSASIGIVNFLLEKQVCEIRCYDPSAMENFKKQFPESEKIKYFNHEFDAVKESDIIIIATDWPQFRGLADIIISELKNRPLIMDGRRMLQHRYDDLIKAGFSVIAVGSPLQSLKHKST